MSFFSALKKSAIRNPKLILLFLIIIIALITPTTDNQNNLSNLPQTVTVVAVGDMACGQNQPEYEETECKYQQVSDVALSLNPDAFLALGDLQNLYGRYQDFQTFYHPSYGRLNHIVHPTIGNHEYMDPIALSDTTQIGYWRYFKEQGVETGQPNQGYYAFNLGQWRLYSLNSNCNQIDGCSENSSQIKWFKKDLASHPRQCQLLFMHNPYINSGLTKDRDDLVHIWDAFYQSNGDIVLSGDVHFYERFQPINPQKQADEQRGIRQFIIGTGGHNLHNLSDPNGQCPIKTTAGNKECLSQVLESSYGVLKLTLNNNSYDWEFIPAAGYQVTDTGSTQCH